MINETCGTLSGHRKASLSLDHFRMNKFSSKHCSHYKHIAYQVMKMAEAAGVIKPST